jgi:hypothetical protein
MPTDFLEYTNLRLLIPKPAAAPANFRSGVPAGAGSWVVHCFTRGETVAAADLASISPRTRILSGFITAYADLPANTSWLAASSAFAWDESGLAPAALRLGMGGRGFLGDIPALPTVTGQALQGEATIIALADPYGPGGIGAEVRAELGDRIRIELQVAA